MLLTARRAFVARVGAEAVSITDEFEAELTASRKAQALTVVVLFRRPASVRNKVRGT